MTRSQEAPIISRMWNAHWKGLLTVTFTIIIYQLYFPVVLKEYLKERIEGRKCYIGYIGLWFQSSPIAVRRA